MKNWTLLLSCCLLALCACQQTKQNVMCHDPHAEFAAFAKDPAFRNMHTIPTEIDYKMNGAMTRIPVTGQDSANAYVVKTKGAGNNYLLLFHEWWGLNDQIKKEADDWAKSLKINVIALDLYDGKVARTADEAGQFMGACKPDRANAIIQATAAFAGQAANFRTMGWCFGGGWSMKAAIALKEKAKACVMYYGMPEENVETLKSLQCDVLFIHAKQDRWINDDVVNKMKANMKSAGKMVDVHPYDADHAFANPSGQHYNEAAASDARVVVLNYLKKHE